MIEKQHEVSEADTSPAFNATAHAAARFEALTTLRTIDVPDFRELVEDDPMALTLVINMERATPEFPLPTEENVLQAVATTVASVMTTLDPAVQAAVEAWCRGRIRKLVKRARAGAWQRLFDSPDLAAHNLYGGGNVLGFIPRPISQMPEELRKLQVQGLQLDRAVTPEAAPTEAYLEIQVNDTLGMSTGKLAAQVGHAAQLFLMRAPEAEVRQWLGESTVRISYVQTVAAQYEIRDAGFTEVAPNSLTAGSTFHTVA